MDITDFLATTASSFDGTQRFGQHWYNSLVTHNPQMAELIANTSLDPFFADRVSDETLSFVVKNWKVVQRIRPHITEQELAEKAWNTTIGFFLSDFPDNADSETILELMEAGDSSIVAWLPFEDHDNAVVLDWMESHHLSLVWLLKGLLGMDDMTGTDHV